MTDAASSHALSASTFKRLHPQAYFNRFLPHAFRPDGRPLDDDARAWRDVSINLGSISTASGSALVRVGETTVTCGVKAEIFEPSVYEPAAGCIGASVGALRPAAAPALIRC
jgi:exosome complex component RRP43